MEYKIQKLYDQVNQAIIRCRGVYSMWAKNNNVSYNRMLVLYTITMKHFVSWDWIMSIWHLILPAVIWVPQYAVSEISVQKAST